jgi:Bardet-Biedl syndrome 7 protein
MRPDTVEVIVTTFSGEVASLSAPPKVQVDTATLVAQHAAEIASAQAEMVALTDRLEQSRQTHASTTTKDLSVGMPPEIVIHDSFTLSETEAAYILKMELPVSVDSVMLQSDIPVDMLDIRDDTAVRSFSPSRPEESNFLLATYTYPPNTTRLQLKVRSIEGQYGTLQAYIVPNAEPKICTVRTYKLCALSLHQRVGHAIDSTRPLNCLTLKGNFEFADMHSWISICLPDVPTRTTEDGSATMTYVSTFLGTQLDCSYSGGIGVFRSDNMSTISILKDVIIKEATSKSISVQIIPEPNFDSVRTTLERLLPRLEATQQLSQKIELIEPLRELQSQEGDAEFMCQDHLDILRDANDLLFQFKQQPSHLDRLVGMITDLFIDANRFKGVDVKKKARKLADFIEVPRDLDDVLEFVLNPP